MNEFAQWLAATPLSVAIQSHLWVIPAVQSIHIVCIGFVLASILMVTLRIFGWAGTDQTLLETSRRFGPWLWGALVVLLLTGAVMVIGEPVRELMSLSFWLKMSLLLIGISAATGFQLQLKRNAGNEQRSSVAAGTKLLAALSLLIWCSIIVMGRLIAYDHVWGSWSLRPIV